MKKNIGKIDKVVRLLLALIFFSSYFFLKGNLKFISLVGIVPLLTGFISFCPIYKVLGISTCPKCDKI